MIIAKFLRPKPYLTLPILLIVVFSCANQNKLITQNYSLKAGQAYYTDSNNPVTGRFVKSENGITVAEGFYKKGKASGIWKRFDKNGSLVEEFIYLDNSVYDTEKLSRESMSDRLDMMIHNALIHDEVYLILDFYNSQVINQHSNTTSFQKSDLDKYEFAEKIGKETYSQLKSIYDIDLVYLFFNNERGTSVFSERYCPSGCVEH